MQSRQISPLWWSVPAGLGPLGWKNWACLGLSHSVFWSQPRLPVQKFRTYCCPFPLSANPAPPPPRPLIGTHLFPHYMGHCPLPSIQTCCSEYSGILLPACSWTGRPVPPLTLLQPPHPPCAKASSSGTTCPSALKCPTRSDGRFHRAAPPPHIPTEPLKGVSMSSVTSEFYFFRL